MNKNGKKAIKQKPKSVASKDEASQLEITIKGNSFKGPEQAVTKVFGIACITGLLALLIVALSGMTAEVVKAFGSWW